MAQIQVRVVVGTKTEEGEKPGEIKITNIERNLELSLGPSSDMLDPEDIERKKKEAAQRQN